MRRYIAFDSAYIGGTYDPYQHGGWFSVVGRGDTVAEVVAAVFARENYTIRAYVVDLAAAEESVPLVCFLERITCEWSPLLPPSDRANDATAVAEMVRRIKVVHEARGYHRGGRSMFLYDEAGLTASLRKVLKRIGKDKYDHSVIVELVSDPKCVKGGAPPDA